MQAREPESVTRRLPGHSMTRENSLPAIRINGVGKSFRMYNTPGARLAQMLWNLCAKVLPHSLRQRALEKASAQAHKFWALKDISFEVQKGEVFGIIGRNGSGKSTLLQIICGTLTQTEGSVETKGRVAALLELGSGFNPEYTGRENVMMNATLLGLSADEIADKFEDIASFADIGDFIDQPVKTYSSGMYVRLAFSVAIHVKPDILVVDEALSVGDIAFRNKCMEVIHRMVAQGVTILFVTHDLGTLQLLCSKVLWLDHGQLKACGDPVQTSQDYYASTTNTLGSSDEQKKPAQQNTGKAEFLGLHLLGGEGNSFMTGRALRIAFKMRANASLDSIVFGLSVYRSDGDWLIGQTSRDENVYWNALKEGETCSGYIDFPSLCLAPGDYLIALAAYNGDYTICYALTDVCCPFSVRSINPTWGKFSHPCVWTIGANERQANFD